MLDDKECKKDKIGDHDVKRAKSTSSLQSQISQGSSQLWDGMSIPDEHSLREIDEIELRHETQSDWRRGEDIVNNASPGILALGGLAVEPSSSGLDDTSNGQSLRLSESVDATKVFQQGPSLASDTRPLSVIAHNDNHQQLFNKHKLPWGVQWEIARLVSSGKLKYGEIPVPELMKLRGPNAVAAPLVEKLLGQQKGDRRHREIYEKTFERELSTRAPWAELDKEEEALKNDPLSGLGCNNGQDDWYGGKVAFIARLRTDRQVVDKSNMPSYRLELDTPELSSSTRFTRRWGSRRFVRVRIPDSILKQRNNRLLVFFKKYFVISGRVFRPFYAKDHSVFLFETNFFYTSEGIELDPDDGRVSFNQFLEWHNPMTINKDQPLAKWCARMALGLSNSVPGVEITAENYKEIDDIYSPAGQVALQAGRKPESKDVMTDGAGYTNQATLIHTKYKYNWDLVPSAIQYRLGGAKGLLLLHPEDNGLSTEQFCVWIRPSQTKIKYDENLNRDRAHLVLDVLRRSQLKYPARLSTEIIVNLAQNGVSFDVFEGLMKVGLEGIAADLTHWSGPYAMQHLWAAVASINGSVVRSRMSREAAGSSRILGFSSDDNEAEEDEATEQDLRQLRPKPGWTDEFSGCPAKLEETVMVLLDSGFEPQSCATLAMKLKEVFKKAMNSYIENYKIVVPRSAEAWILPDPCNVLKAGEIFLKTSERIVGHDDLPCDHLSGDVLVTRHPCRVPADMQKVRAVWKDELRKYCDVIIFSVRGERSLASMLGGGDYDGDTVHVIWEPSIVNAFRHPDEKFADPPPSIHDAFEKDTMTVADYLEKPKGLHDMYDAMDLDDFLLAALKVSLAGMYSNWHDTAVYEYGYEHDEAWRLAYMFQNVLDSIKSGKIVKSNILENDSLLYNRRGPAWKDSILNETSFDAPPQDEAPNRQGDMTRIDFIMDHLKKVGREKYHHHMAEFEKFLDSARQQYKDQQGVRARLYVDPALKAPWFEAKERAQLFSDRLKNDLPKRELEVIRKHVKSVREKHREYLRRMAKEKSQNGRSSTSPRKDKSSSNMPLEQPQNRLRELSFCFSEMLKEENFIFLSPEDVKRCSASYAYILETRSQEYDSQYPKFPFDVAMRELCMIKAQSSGSFKVLESSFYSSFTMTGAIKAFRPADCPPYTY